MKEKAVEVSGVSKSFGRLLAVDSLSFTVDAGSLVGLVGPNGAGKTSTMRIMVGLSHADKGEVLLSGRRVIPGDRKAMECVGYMPDEPTFDNWMTPLEHLEFIGGLYTRDTKEVRRRADELIERFGITKIAKRKTQGFSKGQRQRLGLAHALMGEPEILLMDEPTSGLDPLGRKELLEYIGNLAGKMTILLSTHLLTDVERVCDRVVMIGGGKLLASDTITALKDRYSTGSVLVDAGDDNGALLERLEKSGWCRRASLSEAGVELEVEDVAAAQREIPTAVAAIGGGIRRLAVGEPTLEEAYLRVVRESEEVEVATP